MKERYKPGKTVEVSGQYLVRGARGSSLNREVTCTKGGRFPPTQKPKQTYELSDPTKHKIK